MARTNIVFFEPYPMGFGGNYLTQRSILERLDGDKFKPIVLSPLDGMALDEFRKMGVECVVISPKGKLESYGGSILRAGIIGKIEASFELLKYNLKLASFLRKRKIDLVYANCVRAEMSIGLAARLCGIPSLLYIKGELINPIIDRISFALANKILFFCEENKNDKYPRLVKYYKNKIDILQIGMDPAAIYALDARDKSHLKKELNIDPERINVVVVAQLYRPKGQHLVLEALNRLVKDFPTIKLYFLGDHVIEEYRSYRTELEAYVSKNNLEENVVFTGWRRDALDIVSLMDLLIHPSLAEGFGRAVLESMAVGKPIIASRLGGLREAIEDGVNGYLVTPGNVNEIEQRWRELLLDPGLRKRMGIAAKKTVFEKYLIDDKVDRLAGIWSEMAQKINK